MDILIFILVFIRISMIMMFIPIFGSPAVPWIAKMGFCALLSIIITNSINMELSDTRSSTLILSIASSFIIALSIGLIIRFIFDGIQMAGQYISYEMGFTVMNVIDPISSAQIPIISQFKQLMALLIFFAINGHHYLIKAAVASFEYAPIGTPIFHRSVFENIIRLSGRIFLIAIKLSAPILVAMFITNLAMAIIARAMPQINIFVISFPLYIGLGLIIMGIFMPFFMKFIKNSMYSMISEIYKNLRLLGA